MSWRHRSPASARSAARSAASSTATSLSIHEAEASIRAADLRLTAFVPPWPFVLAEHLGLHRAEALRVELTPTASSPQQLERLREGSVDLAVTAIDNLFAWNADGADVVVVAMAEETTPLRVLARRDLARLEQLRDARLGVDAPGSGFVIVLRHLLSEVGVVDYRLVPSGGVRARLDALLGGAIDATLLGPPFDAAAIDAGMVELADLSRSCPRFPGQGLVARRDRLAELDPRLDALLRAWQAAAAWAQLADDATLLAAAGGAARSAADVRAALPVALEPDPERLRILLRMRSDLGVLPVGASVEDLLAR